MSPTCPFQSPSYRYSAACQMDTPVLVRAPGVAAILGFLCDGLEEEEIGDILEANSTRRASTQVPTPGPLSPSNHVTYPNR